MDILTVPQAAVRAGCGEDRVRKAVRGGTLKALKVGAYRLIDPDDLRRWQEDGTPIKQATYAPGEPAAQPAVKPAAQKPVPPPATQADPATRAGGAPDLQKLLTSIP